MFDRHPSFSLARDKTSNGRTFVLHLVEWSCAILRIQTTPSMDSKAWWAHGTHLQDLSGVPQSPSSADCSSLGCRLLSQTS